MAKLASVKERLHKGYAQTMDVTKTLADEKSQYQHIRIFDTVSNGRVMTLDDIVQITSRDESAYADMLTHLPMLEHGKVERVMIVGGGDLSIADEALKHKGVKEVVLVDIDGRVIELCKQHFGQINAKAFKDKRLKLEVADAFEYLGRKESKNRFDLIIADRPDPVSRGARPRLGRGVEALFRRAPRGAALRRAAVVGSLRGATRRAGDRAGSGDRLRDRAARDDAAVPPGAGAVRAAGVGGARRRDWFGHPRRRRSTARCGLGARL